jgi:hypothetical protein
MKRIIGIDQSLTSTAVCVIDGENINFYCFVRGKRNKWCDVMEDIGVIHVIDDYDVSGSFSGSELKKLIGYRNHAKMITNLVSIDSDDIGIEGYAYRAKGNISDLIAFGTMLRLEIIDADCPIEILAPMSIKTEFAKLVYPTVKNIARNYEGVAGGKFNKHNMLQAVVDGSMEPMLSALKPYYLDLMNMKAIPSPINDCIDAFAIAMIKKKRTDNGNL